LQLGENEVSFGNEGFFFRGCWSDIGSITSGRIAIEPGQIVWQASFKGLFIYGGLLPGLLAVFVAITGASVRFIVGVAILQWLWFVGVHYLVAKDNLRSLVRRAVRGAGFRIVGKL
jgi:hypothetical protein